MSLEVPSAICLFSSRSVACTSSFISCSSILCTAFFLLSTALQRKQTMQYKHVNKIHNKRGEKERKKKKKHFIKTSDYLLFGFFIFSYFGVCLGALQFSLGISKLVPFSVNLRMTVIISDEFDQFYF